MAVRTTVQPFGEHRGKQVNKYIITQVAGIQVCVMNYGATITNIIVPDKTGTPGDVVLGFDSLEGYINAGNFYMGAICGRYANRVANGTFRINGNQYQLTQNNGKNCLHGGTRGFDKVIWNAALLPEGDGVAFTYISKDGEEGFPGNLEVTVTYRVINNTLHIGYAAVTDKSTPINLTSHCYFNLSGGKEATILNHELQLNADTFIEVDSDSIPSGRLLAVKDTAMDFTSLKRTGKEISKVDGYDYSWVLNRVNGELCKAAVLVHPATGIRMTVHTTEPSIHFYSGNYLNGSIIDTKKGIPYGKHAGLCLETQHFPDSPNQSEFPDTILRPGETYRQTTIYSFEQHPVIQQ
ncbi:MAG: aldose epimerase family protein [Chitinophagaceae bacterium]